MLLVRWAARLPPVTHGGQVRSAARRDGDPEPSRPANQPYWAAVRSVARERRYGGCPDADIKPVFLAMAAALILVTTVVGRRSPAAGTVRPPPQKPPRSPRRRSRRSPRPAASYTTHYAPGRSPTTTTEKPTTTTIVPPTTTTTHVPKTVVIDASANGGVVDLNLQDRLELDLDGDPTTGYTLGHGGAAGPGAGDPALGRAGLSGGFRYGAGRHLHVDVRIGCPRTELRWCSSTGILARRWQSGPSA